MSFLRRQLPPGDQGGGGGAQVDAFALAYPAVFEYLSTTAWPDGSTRLTSTLMLFVDSGGVKACLRDRDASQSVWIGGRGVTEALEALEAALTSGRAEWRPDASKKRK